MSRKRQSSDAGSSDCKMGYATVLAGELGHEHESTGFRGGHTKELPRSCLHALISHCSVLNLGLRKRRGRLCPAQIPNGRRRESDILESVVLQPSVRARPVRNHYRGTLTSSDTSYEYAVYVAYGSVNVGRPLVVENLIPNDNGAAIALGINPTRNQRAPRIFSRSKGKER